MSSPDLVYTSLFFIPFPGLLADHYMSGTCIWKVIHSTFFCTRQVARAGRFGTKGLAITFVSDETDAKTLNDVQDRFEVNVAELPDEIDISSYSKFFHQQMPTV